MKQIKRILPYLIISVLFSNDFRELTTKATEHYFNQEYELAYKYSLEILEVSENHPYAHFYIGCYYGFKGEFEKTLHHYDIAIENHTSNVFELAYYQRAITKVVIYKDLTYCEDINVLKEVFKEDDTYQYLEEEHVTVFGLCQLASSPPHLLISSANFLGQTGSCDYSLLFYNEALKNGTKEELAAYDNSLCK